MALCAALLGGAGAETVTKLLGNAAVLFDLHPDARCHFLLADRQSFLWHFLSLSFGNV